jgi:DNA-binding transcriptional ArsR family regulator
VAGHTGPRRGAGSGPSARLTGGPEGSGGLPPGRIPPLVVGPPTVAGADDGEAEAPGADPGLVFAALADPTRRAVLRAVADRGDATATELVDDVAVSRQAVAKHLELLADAGLVTGERVGRERRWRITPAPLLDAANWMGDVGAAWDRRLARLQSRIDPR